jgi:predicted nucleic acid-binding protein
LFHLFLDASAVIYLVEGGERTRRGVLDIFDRLAIERTNYQFAVSRLSHLECRVGPLRSGDGALLRQYDAVLSPSRMLSVELTPEVVDLATAIRAKTRLRTADALQAACALQLGDEHWFVTGDKAFANVTQLNTVLVSP